MAILTLSHLKTYVWCKHSFGILRPFTYQIWMMPSSTLNRFFKIQDGGSGRLENWENRYCICFYLWDYKYTYLQYLTSQIFSLGFLNDIRDKNCHFIILVPNVKNSDLFPKKYILILLSPSLKSTKHNLENICIL